MFLYTYGLSFNVFTLNKTVINPFNFCIRLIKISILYLFPVVSTGFFVCFSWRECRSPTRAPHLRQVFVSGSRQTRPLLQPARQLPPLCRMDTVICNMQINFAIPPISHFRQLLGDFFSLFQSCEIPITLSIRCVIIKHFATAPR